MTTKFESAALLRTLLVAAGLVLATGLAMAQSAVTLTAGASTTTLPDGQTVPMWGYSCGAVANNGVAGAAGVTCTAMNGTPQTGTSWQPPLITVPAGQPLAITLVNKLEFAAGVGTGSNKIPTSLVIVGQLGGGLGDRPVRMPSPAHAPMGTTWPGAPGAADAGVVTVTVTNGGTGYAVNDPVSFSGGGGAGAAGHVSAVGAGGVVTQVTITSAGAGYTSAPTATFGGAGTGAQGTVNLGSSQNVNAPTFVGPPQVDRVRSFATEVAAAADGSSSVVLTWPSLRPGTYLIHSGTQPSIQHPMGLYGVLVVTDDPLAVSPYPGQLFDKDVALLFSEIDPVQNAAVATAVATAGFSDTKVWSAQTGECGDAAVHSCYPPAINYTPLYYLINGVSFDRSNPAASALAVPAAAVQGRLLLRLANAGLRAHTPSVVGANMTVLAEDGNRLPGAPRVQTQLFMAAGKTNDVTIQPKQTVAGSYDAATLAVYDRMLALSTNNNRDGGMQVYLQVAGGAAAGAAGSSASAVTAVANADSYSVVAGQPLTVGSAAKGVIANDVGIYGVAVQTAPTQGVLVLGADGSFTYTPNAGFSGDSFTYCGNGTISGAACASVTLNVCSGACLGAPTAVADAYKSALASQLQIGRPGVLANDHDASGFPLHASAATNGNCGSVTLAADGSFTATRGAGASCTFTYKAINAQNTASAAATVTVNFATASNLAVTVKDAKSPATTVTDYRWIIEEDRTVLIDPAQESKPLCRDNPTLTPPACSVQAVRNVAINFHSAVTPVVAQGCTGPISCESGQAVGGVPAVCDVYGRCGAGTSKTPTLPSDVALDPTKRYFISILPGDAANPLITDGATGHAMGGAQIAAGQTAVDVIVQPLPIQTATIAIFLFQDDYPLNGENDAGGGIDILAPNEAGLGGFNIVLNDQAGAFGDAVGQLTYDMFGMPVTNALAGRIDPATGYNACPISNKGNAPVGIIVTCPKYEATLDGAPTTALSPLAGHALVANMYPGMYEVQAVAGADRIARGEQWLQTNTLDGTKAIEVFIKAGEPGYFQEFGPGNYHVAMGFANPKIIQARKGATGDGKGLVCSNIACSANFYGTVTTTRLSRTPDQRVYSSGNYISNSFTQCYVSLSYPDSADFDFAFCDPDGNFEFHNLPSGNFKITVFDQYNDLLVDGLSTSIRAGAAGAGSAATNRMEIPVMQWRTNLYGRVFLDTGNCSNADGPGKAGDGVSQSCEPGLPLVPLNVRYRDGSYANFNNTDLSGYAGFNEVFPRLNWLVVDSDQARYKLTGVHVVYDAQGPVDVAGGCGADTRGCGQSLIANGYANTLESPTAGLPAALRIPGSVYCSDADCTTENRATLPGGGGTGGSTARVDPGWASTQGWQGLLGSNAFIEFAMQPFKKKGDVKAGLAGVNPNYGENGGIRGHVIYASTRAFDDPALALQAMWTPGIASAKVNLYQKTVDANGVEHLTLVDTTLSTSFDDWAQGFRRNADGSLVGNATTGFVPNMNCPGQETTSPFYYTMLDGRFPLDETRPLAERGRFKCYDGWSMASAVQPAPYNGMYKFPSVVAKQGGTKTLPTGEPGLGNDLPTASNWFLQLDPKNFKTNCTICTTNPDDGTPMLPPGTYVVEVVLPPGYEVVKEEDKNILQGDAYIAPAVTQFAGFGNIFIMPDQAAVNAFYNPKNRIQATTNNGATPRREGDTGSVEVFWPCVGEKRIVPDFLSLYPQAGLQAPFAGAKRPLCDRKELVLDDEMTALAKFYLFTSAHVASHFTGTITNDFASEFDPFSPQFGEKFAVPNLPVAVKDFSGREISRVYGDQWGIYNGMTSSTWTVFPPSPSGYIPNMMIMCMNDPGPVKDTRPGSPTFGQDITDPNYSPAYSNFCYEIPYMPGQTSYLDTPVLPTMGFAAGYNLPDCEYPDTTPAIKSVNNSLGKGPWVDLGTPAAGASLSFTVGGVSNNTSDRINSVSIGTTQITSSVLRCGPSVSGSTSVTCTSNANNNMAAALRANINLGTASHGYTAGGSNATVTITAAAATGAARNGLALAVNQTGLNAVTGVALAGGINAAAGTTSNVLTITALGDRPVLNHAYSGPNATQAPFNNKFITRHYGFGAAAGTVTIGGVNAPVVSWSDLQMQVSVPANVPACTLQQRNAPAAQCGELVITAANGTKSIDTVTVTIGGKAPIYVGAGAGGAVTVTYPAGYPAPIDTDKAFGRLEPSPLQSAIDNAKPGDLIIVGPGTYRDNLLMWKPVRLQGVGAESVTINADAHPAGKLDAWRREVNCLFGLSLDGRPMLNDGQGVLGTGMPYDPSGQYSCPASMQQRVDRIPDESVIGWDTTGNGNLAQMIQEPTLMGAYEGAGVTVLGRGVAIPDCLANGSNATVCNDFWGTTSAGGYPAGYRYLTAADCNRLGGTVTSGPNAGKPDGRDYGSANFLCNPSRIDGLSVINSSQGGGAIYAHAWNHNLEVSNNRVRANHGTLTGGISIGAGEFPEAFVCDALVLAGTTPLPFPNACSASAQAAEPPGYQYGYGFNVNTKVHHNMVTGNASIGDSLYSATPSAAGGISFCSGADGYLLEGNWVCGNMSYGDSGGVAHVGFINDGVMRGNWVLFNQSQQATLPVNGGGIGVLGAATADREIVLPDGTTQECGFATQADCPPGMSEGTGRRLLIERNMIAGNAAESGSGGGIRLQLVNGADVPSMPSRPELWNDVTLQNNIIANNVAGWDGGGVSMQDALKVRLINNTVMNNDATASAGVLFKTIGAPQASTPPPGCTPADAVNATCPDNINNTSTNQTAGVVTMSHTPVLVAAVQALPNLPSGAKLACPEGYGYYSAGGALNASCVDVSLPLLMNNVLWHNRAFHVEVGNLGTGLQNTQKVVTLVPSLNQTATGLCAAAGTANGAPGSGGAVNYWDIGVRGDTGPATHSNTGLSGPGGWRLTPRNSILTVGDYAGNGNLLGSDPQVLANYCNGSRLPPEGGGLFAGYNAPAGRSETTGLYPVFALNQTVASPTVDEGNNWVNLSWGPLSLSNASAYTAPNTLMAPMADYRLNGGSPAVDAGTPSLTFGVTAINAPANDFFGNARSGNPDIGAVERAGAVAQGNTVTIGGTPLAAFSAPMNGTSAAQTVTLTAAAANTSAVTGLAFAFPAGSRYSISATTCGTTLAANASCTISIVFHPLTTATVNDVLAITANAPVTGLPATVNVTGAGAPPPLPAVAVLDNFNRANANTLGASWAQVVITGAAALRVDTNTAVCANANLLANCTLTPLAYWNAAPFGTAQAAAMTVGANATSVNGEALLLKMSGVLPTVPTNWIRVLTSGAQITVATTTTAGLTYTTAGTLAAPVASGNTLTARADATGQVWVWVNSTFAGVVQTSFTGNGRIGMQVPLGLRVDNFAGGNAP